MAKLNKSEAIEAARRAARQNQAAKEMTLERLAAIEDYRERRKLATDICALYYRPVDVQERYVADGEQAFIDTIMVMWQTLETQRENARRTWKSMLGCTTVDQATAKVVELVNNAHVRGVTVAHGSGVTLYMDRLRPGSHYGNDATCYVRFERDHDSRIVNPDNNRQCAGYYTAKIELSWGGTSHSLANSAASIKAYTDLLELANEIQAVLENDRIAWVFGLDEPKAE